MLEALRSPGSSVAALPVVRVDHIGHLPPTIAVVAEEGARPDRPLVDLGDAGAVLRDLYCRRGTLVDPDTEQPLRAWTPDTLASHLVREPEGTRFTLGAPLPVPDSPERLLAELRRQGFARIRLRGRVVRLDSVERLPKGVGPELIVDRVKQRPGAEARLREGLSTAWKAGSGTVSVEITSPDKSTRTELFRSVPTRSNGEPWPTPTPHHLDRKHPRGACPECLGDGCDSCEHTGLGEVGRHLVFAEHRWPALLSSTVEQAVDTLTACPEAQRMVASLEALIAVGLGHLPLDRPLSALSAGEWRRAVLARVLPLAEPPRLLIVDEPLAGLSTKQAHTIAQALRAIADQGVGVLAVEHRSELLTVADHEVGFGPGSGPEGGRVVYEGAPRVTPDEPHPSPLKRDAAGPGWTLPSPDLPGLALPEINVPQGIWTVITGASGTGKSRLLDERLAPLLRRDTQLPGWSGPEARVVRSTPPVGGHARSCVATTAGIWSTIRGLLARTRDARVAGLGADAFTFNRASGWCATCEGLGSVPLQLGPFAPIFETCPTCQGGRLSATSGAIRWRGRSPSELLALDLAEAARLFSSQPKMAPVLQALVAVGLGHLPLGRRTSSLSPGERRRFGVATAVAKVRPDTRDPRPVVVILDGPDVGLDDHTARSLATWLAAALPSGTTLLTAAHHPAMLAAADRVVALG